MATAEIILFGIRAGLQLYGSVRKAYVDGTRGRALTLPIPRSADADWTSALVWFKGDGKAVAARYPRVQELVAIDEPDASQRNELFDLFVPLYGLENPGVGRGEISQDDLDALLRIRQWESGSGPDPTALQQIAGTLVNVAIDYFAETPGAISDQRPEGRALRSLLTALDKQDFSTIATREIAPGLLVAVLDSVANNPDLVAGGEKEQAFVETVTAGLATSVQQHLKDAPSADRKDAAVWVNLVARAVIKGGAETVLANPSRFLDLDGDQAALVQRVGKTLTDLVVGEDKVTLRPLLSGDGMTTVAKSVLAAVAENPGLLKVDDQGIRNVLVGVAGSLAESKGTFTPDVFPEVARLVLAKTAENMDLIWGEEFADPKNHLLLTATKTLLAGLSAPGPAGSTWKPVLTRAQLMTALEAVLDEVVDNPQWVLAKAGDADPDLAVAVEAIVAALRQVDGARISADTGIAVLRAGILAVGLQRSFLAELPATAQAPARAAITSALDAVFGTVFGADATAEQQWRLARNSTLVALVEVGLDEVATAGATQAHIDILREAVLATLKDTGPFDWSAFQNDLRTRLAA